MKLMFEKYSILIIAMVFGIATMNACGSTVEKSANNSSTTGTAQNNPATGEKGHAENKVTENKTAPETPQADLVEVYDGRIFGEKPEKEASQADTKFVAGEFKSREDSIRQKLGDQYCSDPNDAEVTVYNSVEGAFTKPNSKQKAYLYSVCELGRGFGVGGILIAENETVVAHYAGQVGWSSLLSTLPDINKNGVLELTYPGGGGGQGYFSGSVELLEFKDGIFKSLGDTDTYSDNSGADLDESKTETLAYKISVQPSASPVFFRETYEKKGNAKNWSLAKKSEKISLDKGDSSQFSKVD